LKSPHIDFDSLLHRHKDMIYNLLFRLTGNHHTSEDLFQETFIKVYRGLQSFKGKSQISTWIYSIAVNVFKDHKRKNSRNLPGSSIDDISENLPADTNTPNPETQVLREEEKNRLQAHINSLKKSMKIPGSIKVSLHRARNSLKSTWGNIENEKKQY
jgi:RNA polymerase sigma factor (sigma-70 family)